MVWSWSMLKKHKSATATSKLSSFFSVRLLPESLPAARVLITPRNLNEAYQFSEHSYLQHQLMTRTDICWCRLSLVLELLEAGILQSSPVWSPSDSREETGASTPFLQTLLPFSLSLLWCTKNENSSIDQPVVDRILKRGTWTPQHDVSVLEWST